MTLTLTHSIYVIAYEKKSRAYQPRSFLDDEDPTEYFGRSMKNVINCPEKFQCTKLHKEANSVCCPKIEEEQIVDESEERPQTSENISETLLFWNINY